MSIIIFLSTVIILLLLLLYIRKRDNEKMLQRYYSTMMTELDSRSRNQFIMDASMDNSLISASSNSSFHYGSVDRRYPVTPIPTKKCEERPKMNYREFRVEEYLKKNN